MKINSAPSLLGQFIRIYKVASAIYFKRTDFGAGCVQLLRYVQAEIVMRIETTTTYCNITNVVVYSTVKNDHYIG